MLPYRATYTSRIHTAAVGNDGRAREDTTTPIEKCANLSMWFPQQWQWRSFQGRDPRNAGMRRVSEIQVRADHAPAIVLWVYLPILPAVISWNQRS